MQVVDRWLDFSQVVRGVLIYCSRGSVGTSCAACFMRVYCRGVAHHQRGIVGKCCHFNLSEDELEGVCVPLSTQPRQPTQQQEFLEAPRLDGKGVCCCIGLIPGVGKLCPCGHFYRRNS